MRTNARSARPTRTFGVLALVLCLATPALAQQRPGLTGYQPGGAASDAYLQRQVRQLDADRLTGTGSSLQLRQTQRDLITRSRGVALTPEQARIQRELDRIGRDLQWQETTDHPVQAPATPRGDRLPSTIDDTGGLLSFGGAMTVSRLLGRAQNAMAEGRTGQARSDLATARTLAQDLSPASDAERATAAGLQSRLADLTRKLGES